MYITFLQVGSIKDLEDHGSRPVGIRHISNATLESLLQNFTSICKRYTKVMAIKHQLQHHMFNNTNFVNATIYLETAAFRLQHIQVSNQLNYNYSYNSNCRCCILANLVWSSQHTNT